MQPHDSVTRREFDEFKRLVEIMELDLRTRIDAVEYRQKGDIDVLQTQLTQFANAQHEANRKISDLHSLFVASQFSLIHLMGMMARQMKVPKRDLEEALKQAKDAVTPAVAE